MMLFVKSARFQFFILCWVTTSLLSTHSRAADLSPTPQPQQRGNAASSKFEVRSGERIALVGNATAERMNLYGNFETKFHLLTADQDVVFRNFGWPAEEVAQQQRPGNYTEIDDPLEVFAPSTMICFFGFNESFTGSDPASIQAFKDNYRKFIDEQSKKFSTDDRPMQFVLVSPIAFEPTGIELQPLGDAENAQLEIYTQAIQELSAADGYEFVDLFHPTLEKFTAQPGAQYTVNGAHVIESGDQLMAEILSDSLLGTSDAIDVTSERFVNIRHWVNDKSWYHQQDYRMLNGWYVYGGRRTWDTQTFPSEYRKIRKITSVRDQYIWDLVDGQDVPDEPDDTGTGEVFEPETMFGSRDENFRAMREPEELIYPSPEESIEMMTVPEGFRVDLFASEREFPELANPNQIAFDGKGRLWVSCMPNYPQWQPGSKRPDDRLLILEDTDADGKADKCTSFYDKLICPTGFEFWDGGVIVVDEPRILYLKDTDGDDKADVVEQWIDGIATDDTHHTMGAWEFSHGGKLHMLEGISLSTTLETPWGPFRNKNTGGAYIFDPRAQTFSHYRTPGYGNPWCLVFDEWGNGIIGDGTNARQHWISPLAGAEVDSRKTLQPVFDNEGMRPAVGSEFLMSRHLPEDVQGQFIYACVINMHGMPRFNLRDSEAGYEGERIADLLSSTDQMFRPVDPKVGPDGAIWFGDWCNALIGHMQYSQRDPNRDHTHGRVYRMIYEGNPLIEPVSYDGLSVAALLEELSVPELRTRYRIRREIREHTKADVLAAVESFVQKTSDPMQLCEAMWAQESFDAVSPELLDRLLRSEDFHARSAAMHVIGNQRDYLAEPLQWLERGIADAHPRVRLEAIRGLSFFNTNEEALGIMLAVTQQPMDYWIEYTLEHALNAFEPMWQPGLRDEDFVARFPAESIAYVSRHQKLTGPGGFAVKPLETADDVDAAMGERLKAIGQLSNLGGGNAGRGEKVYTQVCSACHMVGDLGKKFGPDLSDIGSRMSSKDIVTSIILPNDQIAKGYETVMVVTEDAEVISGFILSEDDQNLNLGIANGKEVSVEKELIVERKAMKASSMPEGLAKTIAPIEFLDLLVYLTSQKGVNKVTYDDDWFGAKSVKPAPLRANGDLAEISRDAKIKFGKGFDSWNPWNKQTYLLLQPLGISEFDFAFHSTHSVAEPNILIEMPESAPPVEKIWLKNRLTSQFHSRAEGLTVWSSMDGKKFDKVWTAEKPADEYWIDLSGKSPAKFFRIGLEGEGTFHLYQAAFFGNP